MWVEAQHSIRAYQAMSNTNFTWIGLNSSIFWIRDKHCAICRNPWSLQSSSPIATLNVVFILLSISVSSISQTLIFCPQFWILLEYENHRKGSWFRPPHLIEALCKCRQLFWLLALYKLNIINSHDGGKYGNCDSHLRYHSTLSASLHLLLNYSYT